MTAMAVVGVGDDAVVSSVMDLFEAVKETKKESGRYESVLDSIESTLTILIPIVREKNQLNEVLDRGYGEAKLWDKIKKGAALVRRISEGNIACCACFARADYTAELEELDQLLKAFCNDALQTQQLKLQSKSLEDMEPNFRSDTLEVLQDICEKETDIQADRVPEVENVSDTRKGEVKDILDTLIEAKVINVEVQLIRQSLGRLLPPGKTSSTPSSSLQPLPRKQQQATEEIVQVEDNYSAVKILHAQIKQIYEEMELVRAERERLKALTVKMKKPFDGEFDHKEADSLRPWPQELQVKDIQRAVKDIHADVKNIRDKMEAIHGDIQLGTKDPPKLNIPAGKVRGSRVGAGAEPYQGMVKDTTSKQVTRKDEQLQGALGEARGISKDLDPSNSTKKIGTASNPDETAIQPQWMTAKPQKLDVKDIEDKMKRTTGIGMPKMEIVQVESKDGRSEEKDIIRD